MPEDVEMPQQGALDLDDPNSANQEDTAENLLIAEQNGATSLAKAARPRIKVKIKKYHPVGCWHWDVESENCAICQLPFDACCPDCTRGGDECPPVWGKCTHSYHMHCIVKWLSKEKHCPICRGAWEFKMGT